ncbi:MAG: DNA polymerase Y family protein [Rhodospirillaceae bacterium]|nr:DNA polymerase Y family protein [Rhodospirillaceae bacterium]
MACVTEQNGHALLVAVNRAAEVAGLQPGLPLTDARALCPHLHTTLADPNGERAALGRLSTWCGRYTPWAALDPDSYGSGAGGVWLEVTGSTHLFGGEDAMLADLDARLSALGYTHRLGIADTPGAAWAAARFLQPLRAPVVAIPVGEIETALAPLSVAALRLTSSIVEGLFRLGLRQIGQLMERPRGPLAARFGSALINRLDQALGRRAESIEPGRPPPSYQSRLTFAEPMTHRAGIEASLERLLDALCKQLAAARVGARRVRLSGYKVDGGIAEITVGTGRAVREAVHLRRLFEQKLDDFDPGFGIDTLILAAAATDSLMPAQSSLTNDANDAEALAYLLDRLGNRLGPDHVHRLAPTPRHPPEHAQTAVPAQTVPAAPEGDGPTAPRPLQLLASPEPIEVIAPVPDRPPVMFRWRRQRHRVAAADGPERIAPEWWLEDPAELFSSHTRLRDYYRVEDTEGRRFWLFRAGLYRPDRALKWYMHGFFP